MNQLVDRDAFQSQVTRRITNSQNELQSLRETLPANIPANGWLQTDQWTRTGNFTFTMPFNSTAIYRPGMKIRYKLPGGVSYEKGVVYSSVYVPSTTTITLITNTDFAMTATPDLMFYSPIEYPEDWPDWFNYLPVYTGSGGMTYTGVTTNSAIFSVKGRTMQVYINAVGTTGGVANISLLASLPCTVLAGQLGPAQTRDAAAGSPVLASGLSTTTDAVVRKTDSSNYGLGAGRILAIDLTTLQI